MRANWWTKRISPCKQEAERETKEETQSVSRGIQDTSCKLQITNSTMRLDATLWTVTFCVGVMVWFYRNLSTEINYARHTQLVDPVSGSFSKPKDLLDLSKVINITEQYIGQTNAQERLYDLEYMMNFENPIALDHSYSDNRTLLLSGLPVANEARCGTELGWILDKFDKFANNYTLLRGRLGFELTNLMDSFGKPEAGAYNGVVHWMGSYKGCMKASLNGDRIKTRYCIGQMTSKWWPKNETITPRTSIRVGLCIPETCSTISFEKYGKMIEKLAKLDLSEQYRETLQLNSMFCLPDERSPIRKLPTAGYVFLTIVGGWILVVILASGLHEYLIRTKRTKVSDIRYRCEINSVSNEVECNYFDQNGTKQENLEQQQTGGLQSLLSQLLMSLSLRVTVKEFKSDTFKVRYKSGERVRVHLGCLDFFKIVFAVFVVLGHSCYLTSIYSRDLSNRIERNIDGAGKMALTIGRLVDTFFLFFGLLTSYTLLKKFNLKQLANPLSWVMVNLGIFLRITPMFMLVYWYNKSVSPYQGAGPWWDYGVFKWSMRGQCMSDAWWRSIPYFGCAGSNVPVPACNLPSWFLVSYSQISLILPLLTYLLCTLPGFFLKTSLVVFLSLVSSLNIGLKFYWQTSVREEAFTLYGGFLADLMEKFESLGHMATLGRLGAAGIGSFVGYLLHLYEQRKILDWPKWLTSNLTLLLVVLTQALIILSPLIGHLVFVFTGHIIPLSQVTVFSSLIMIVFPILNSITIISMTTVNNHAILVRFLSHSFWKIFNRLGFAIYLVHWEVIFVGLTSYEQAPMHLFLLDVFKVWAFALSTSILLALAIYLFIEGPISRLSMVFMKQALASLGQAAILNHQRKQTNCNKQEMEC